MNKQLTQNIFPTNIDKKYSLKRLIKFIKGIQIRFKMIVKIHKNQFRKKFYLRRNFVKLTNKF